MIEPTQGNLLEADAEALVNTVNCVGVMGKGIALQFKQAFPANFDAYRLACKDDRLVPGTMHVHETGLLDGPRYIVNFPTKRHWRGKSRIEDIASGLDALVETIQRLQITSIAVPPLGCGYGGLEWTRVKALIEATFDPLPNLRVLLYGPSAAPHPASRPIGTPKPKLTRARALYLSAMARYSPLDFKRTLLEVQKLAYFLQSGGENLKLHYKASHYGPYADNLNKVLEALEGHYTTGYEGSRQPDREIELRPGAAEEAQSFLSDEPTANDLLNRVSELIDGFETPYGMELLSTVHWVATTQDPPARTEPEAFHRVQAWNPRKQRLFTKTQVSNAWHRLAGQAWL